MEVTDFQETVWQKANELYRDMPWRRDTRPYYILVSEIMLQQTQAERVVPKFEAFIAEFPNEQALAQASLADVLKLWSGLGYNRRAKFLHECAKQIVELGSFPGDAVGLTNLPGVGANTAGAILAYAFNQPAIFVETNVRTVYFHHFFHEADAVSDGEIRELLEQTIDHEHPREFYWALMDYGSWLKRQGAGRLGKSKHYTKQSPLAGSVREIRGMIVKRLAQGDVSEGDLIAAMPRDERFEPALKGLIHDGLVQRTNSKLHLTK